MPASEKACRQEQDGPHQGQQGLHDDAHDPEWDRKKPEQGPDDEKQEGERPADGQENGPEEQNDEDLHGVSEVSCL